MKSVRIWLMYPNKMILRPIVYEMDHLFAVVPNVRQASVGPDIGILCLELSGSEGEVQKAIAWLEAEGVKVEPVEINTIEG